METQWKLFGEDFLVRGSRDDLGNSEESRNFRKNCRRYFRRVQIIGQFEILPKLPSRRPTRLHP